MEVMFEEIGLKAFDLDQYLQSALKNKMGNFDGTDIQKSYTQAQGKDDETVKIASRSRRIGRKPQAWKKTASTPGLNIVPAKYPSTTSGITQESTEYEDASLLGR